MTQYLSSTGQNVGTSYVQLPLNSLRRRGSAEISSFKGKLADISSDNSACVDGPGRDAGSSCTACQTSSPDEAHPGQTLNNLDVISVPFPTGVLMARKSPTSPNCNTCV